MAALTSKHRGVRYDMEHGEFIMRCDSCANAGIECYYPMTLEFWDPEHGLTRCRACWTTHRRIHRKDRRTQTSSYYERNRGDILFKRKLHYIEHRDEILADRRAKYAAKKGNHEPTLAHAEL